MRTATRAHAQDQTQAVEKLTKQQRADLAFRYLDWLLTKDLPSGGFRLLYAISQRLNDENQFHCYPSIEYLAAKIDRAESTVWEMLPKLEKCGAIEITWGKRGSRHPNIYRLPAEFLDLYFGPANGRNVVSIKPRRAGVSKPPETPVEPAENPGLLDRKPRPAGVSHLVATDSHKSAAFAARSADADRGAENLNSEPISESATVVALDDVKKAYLIDYLGTPEDDAKCQTHLHRLQSKNISKRRIVGYVARAGRLQFEGAAEPLSDILRELDRG